MGSQKAKKLRSAITQKQTLLQFHFRNYTALLRVSVASLQYINLGRSQPHTQAHQAHLHFMGLIYHQLGNILQLPIPIMGFCAHFYKPYTYLGCSFLYFLEGALSFSFISNTKSGVIKGDVRDLYLINRRHESGFEVGRKRHSSQNIHPPFSVSSNRRKEKIQCHLTRGDWSWGSCRAALSRAPMIYKQALILHRL